MMMSRFSLPNLGMHELAYIFPLAWKSIKKKCTHISSLVAAYVRLGEYKSEGIFENNIYNMHGSR